MSNSQLDLSQLALDRAPTEQTASKPRPRRWFTRYVLPAAILFGFFGLLGAAAGARMLPQPSVEVLPVIVKRATVQQAGTSLFQAAGWIEPRPTSISVAALAPGVIDELLVVEGQQVKKGEPIARLITIDAELDVEQAEATLAIREGELARAEAQRRAAKVRVRQPVHLQVQLADAQSMLAKAQTELAKLPFLIQAAQAQVAYARGSLAGKQAAQSAIAGRVLQQAESEHAGAQADLHELQRRKPNLQYEVDALQSKVKALQTQLDLMIEETRQLEEAEANVQSARALRDEAASQLRQAELMLRRTVIRAPISGRVLRLLAAPGTRMMGLQTAANQSSSTVVEMYDPAMLQVRADVRLEDVPLVRKGQPVEIETASSANVIRGRVLQATSTASVQKNTLEVKVQLIDPPATVSPEMLVTATFLAPQPEAAQAGETTEKERVFVPKQLVQTSDAGSVIWIVDAGDQARRVSITIGEAASGELVEVSEGLNVTDKLVASGTEGLQPGDLVHVTGEDRSIGAE